MTRIVAVLCVAVLMGVVATRPAAAQVQAGAPVVVELYTSEGCSSCPPADRFLFELREREGVIALAFHVDYWDYLGWSDRFARHDYTVRQRAYARALGSPMVYTPQIVVGGATHVVGSNRRAVDDALQQAAAHGAVVDVGLSWTEQRSLVIDLPASDWRGKATIWFVRYADGDESRVTSGENAGRTLEHANIVEELTALGMWEGEAMTITLPWEAVTAGTGEDRTFGCAIIVQPEGLGPILGAREIDWTATM